MVDIGGQRRNNNNNNNNNVPHLPRTNLGIAVLLGILIGSTLERNVFSMWDVFQGSDSNIDSSSSSSALLRMSTSTSTTTNTNTNTNTNHKEEEVPLAVTTGLVTKLSDVPFRPTSHVDDRGRPIEKQQFLEPFVIPRFVGYSVATFKPGQTMLPVHEHESLHEFFYVLEGSGMFRVNDVDYPVSRGWFLHMAPHDQHGIWVPEDSEDGDLKMAVTGVTLD